MRDFLTIAKTALKWNCIRLQVPVPTVTVVEPTELPTPTIKCAVKKDGSEMRLNRTFVETQTDEVFIWLAMSHEARHFWQMSRGFARDFGMTAAQSVEEFNLQDTEVDAWAWACFVVSVRFRRRAELVKMLGEAAWEKVKARRKVIEKELVEKLS